MRKPKIRELKEAIKSLVLGPYTSRFPKEPSLPPETYRGKPEFIKEECVGCAACSEVCPAGAIEVRDQVEGRTGKRSLILRYDSCIFCGQCQANCITEKGIKLTQEYDLALKDRTQALVDVEKDLLLCEVCGGVIGAVDHIKWLVKRLGPLAYSNPTLFLTSFKELAVVEEVSPRERIPLRRSDHMRILCPRCRRETILTEEWGK